MLHYPQAALHRQKGNRIWHGSVVQAAAVAAGDGASPCWGKAFHRGPPTCCADTLRKLDTSNTW